MKAQVLFVSGRETSYIRNRVILAALSAAHDVTVLTPSARSTPARLLGGAARLLTCRAPHELCFAGFYGQPLALAASITRRAPVILDAFVSTYDTLCEDRRIFSPRSPAGRLAFWLDEAGCRRAACVLTDTEVSAEYLASTFNVPRDKLAALPVGCDEAVFFPRPTGRPASQFEVFHYGAFLGLHGTDVIVRAAALLRDCRGIHFTLGGDGPLRHDTVALVEELGLDNVSLPGWIPFERLPDYIAGADLCLGGHFSTIPKAQRVVATKTYQFIAMARPTIVGDNAASREAFVPGEHVLAVTMGDPEALARAIAALWDDAAMRGHLAGAGYALFQERYSSAAIGRRLTRIVDEVLAEHRGQPWSLHLRSPVGALGAPPTTGRQRARDGVVARTRDPVAGVRRLSGGGARLSPARRHGGVWGLPGWGWGATRSATKTSSGRSPAIRNVTIIRGPVPDTLPRVTAERVCYLSLDMSSAAAEVAALGFFWDRLVPGADRAPGRL